MYAPSNQPPGFRYNVNDSRQKLTVWVELCGNGNMLGPFFFDGNVNGQSYLNLWNDEDITLMTMFQSQLQRNRFQRLWYTRDGAPCHGLLVVCARLNQLFGEGVLSLLYNTEWSPRSPDFLIWGYLKDKNFGTPPQSFNICKDFMKNFCLIFPIKVQFCSL